MYYLSPLQPGGPTREGIREEQQAPSTAHHTEQATAALVSQRDTTQHSLVLVVPVLCTVQLPTQPHSCIFIRMYNNIAILMYTINTAYVQQHRYTYVYK